MTWTGPCRQENWNARKICRGCNTHVAPDWKSCGNNIRQARSKSHSKNRGRRNQPDLLDALHLAAKGQTFSRGVSMAFHRRFPARSTPGQGRGR
eukprot:7428231-Alexandrium_andersonii.AAC.1